MLLDPETLHVYQQRAIFGAAWHHFRGREKLSETYKGIADEFAAAAAKKLN
jgi:hypothetical protein